MKYHKSEKGVTLLILVVYIIIFVMIIGTMTTVSTFFFGNISESMNTPSYASEFNKFAMFFVVDIKRNNSATVSSDSVTFADGTKYLFSNNRIYRNDVLIAEEVLNCTFTSKTYNVNAITKNIINANITIGKTNNIFNKDIDFVLKYW